MAMNKLWQGPRFTGYKLLSILAALLVWLYVTDTNNPMTEGTYNVPVELRNLSSNLAQPETNYQVQVRVQATSAQIDAMTSRDIVAYVDLTGAEEGEAAPSIVVELPEGVTLVSKSIDNIQITLEKKVSRDFDLSVRVIGQPAEGYSLLDAVLSPEIVTLSGTAEHINSVDSVQVAADVTNLDSSFSRNLSVEVLDAAGNNISGSFVISPSTAGVVLPLVYEQPEASLAVRAVTTGAPAAGYQVSQTVVQPSTLRAFGDLATLNSLYYLETETIDISGLRQTTSFTARVRPVKNITLSADAVTVVVQVVPVQTATFTKEQLVMQNLPDGLSYQVPALTMEVVVSGADAYISGLTAEDIVAYVDCSSITESGVYNLDIQLSLPANVNLVSVTPDSLGLTVEMEEPAEGEGEGEPPAGGGQPVEEIPAGGEQGEPAP